jgi:hypothetical protein
MAKSSRASSRKANNQRLKANVFGPIEKERNERLSTKLLELAAAPKPERPESETMNIVEEGDAASNDTEKRGAVAADDGKSVLFPLLSHPQCQLSRRGRRKW